VVGRPALILAKGGFLVSKDSLRVLTII